MAENPAQVRYHVAEELALENTIKQKDQLLEGGDLAMDEQAFLRTFDLAFSLGFACAVVMKAQGFDITSVDTSQTTLEI